MFQSRSRFICCRIIALCLSIIVMMTVVCPPALQASAAAISSKGYIDEEIKGTNIAESSTTSEEEAANTFIVKKPSTSSDVTITSAGLETMPYKLMVSIADQRVYILKKEKDDIKLEKVMVCSTGRDSSPTPTGTFILPPDNSRNVGKWYYFSEFKVYAQYYRRISRGYLFHSVLFNKKDEKSVVSSSVKNLGKKASHGCIRLSVEDAKWMYENIKGGMLLEIVPYSLKVLSEM